MLRPSDITEGAAAWHDCHQIGIVCHLEYNTATSEFHIAPHLLFSPCNLHHIHYIAPYTIPYHTSRVSIVQHRLCTSLGNLRVQQESWLKSTSKSKVKMWVEILPGIGLMVGLITVSGSMNYFFQKFRNGGKVWGYPTLGLFYCSLALCDVFHRHVWLILKRIQD